MLRLRRPANPDRLRPQRSGAADRPSRIGCASVLATDPLRIGARPTSPLRC